MRRHGLLKCAVIGLVAAAVGGSIAYAADEATSVKPPAKKRHILYLTHSAGFNHPVLALSEKTLTEMGKHYRAFDVTCLKGYEQEPDKIDLSIITPDYLKQFDAIVFYTSGVLPFTTEQKKAIVEFVKNGKGIVGIHAATDTFREKPEAFPEWGEMFGARFKTHGCNDVPLAIKVEGPRHPITMMLPKDWSITDEMYQFVRPVPRDKFHILLSIDTDKCTVEDLKKHSMEKGKVYDVAWCRKYGKGHVFYTSLGHRDDVWTNKLYQGHLIVGIRWAMGDVAGESTPTAPQSGFVAGFERGRESAKIVVTRALVEPDGALARSIESYRKDVGVYPDKLTDLINKPADAQRAAKWKGPYTEEKWLKDKWEQELHYRVPGARMRGTYDLWSVGPDGDNETRDDIGNWSPPPGGRKTR